MAIPKLNPVFSRERESKRLRRLKEYLFTPRFHFSRFQFNLAALFFISIGLVSGSYLALSRVISFISARPGNQVTTKIVDEHPPVPTPSITNQVKQQEFTTDSENTPSESTHDSLVKCLGADRQFSYALPEICNTNRKYWTQILGYFPTDPEEIIQCQGADGKYSYISRKTCEDTNKFWADHPPPGTGNSSSSASSSSSSSDTTAPTIPGTPTTTTPTTDTTPTWIWTASTDSGSGLAAIPYSVQWCGNSGFTGCDSNVSTSATNSFTHGTALSDGTWYFKAKTTDNAGNNSLYTPNGTVVIDTTAPSTPGIPATTSPTEDTTPTWTWTTSTDTGSGLANPAYTVEWSQDVSFGSGVSTATSTTNSFTHVSALAGGTWYFRVKSADLVSKYSSYSSNGTVVVDTFVLKDQFSTNLPVDTVNNTAAEPGPGTRTVIDTEHKISITNNVLTISGGRAAPGFSDPALKYAGVDRAVGNVFIANINQASGQNKLGWASSTTPRDGYYLAAGGLYLNVNNNNLQLGSYPYNKNLALAIVSRQTGSAYFRRYNGSWLMDFVQDASTFTQMIPSLDNYSAVYTAKLVAVNNAPKWFPSPLLSDGFSGMTSDGLGHQEGISGGLGVGGNGLSWSDSIGIWSNSSGVTTSTSLTGGLAIRTTNVGVVDLIHAAAVTLNGGNAGVVTRYVDANNYIYAYVLNDGAYKVSLHKVVAGVDSQVMAPTAITYVAGKSLMVVSDGPIFWVMYNNAIVDSSKAIADSALQSSTIVGLYTTDITNGFDNVYTYSRGNDNAYTGSLNQFAGTLNTFTDDFERADGAPGYSSDYFYWGMSGSSPATISGGSMVIADAGGSASMSYGNINLPYTPTTMSAIATWTGGTGDQGGNVVLISGVLEPRIDNMVHFRVAAHSWDLTTRDNGNWSEVLAGGTFSPALSVNVQYTISMDLSGNTATLHLPDGTSSTITDSRIGTQKGRYVDYELTQDNSTLKKPRFESVSANW